MVRRPSPSPCSRSKCHSYRSWSSTCFFSSSCWQSVKGAIVNFFKMIQLLKVCLLFPQHSASLFVRTDGILALRLLIFKFYAPFINITIVFEHIEVFCRSSRTHPPVPKRLPPPTIFLSRLTRLQSSFPLTTLPTFKQQHTQQSNYFFSRHYRFCSSCLLSWSTAVGRSPHKTLQHFFTSSILFFIILFGCSNLPLLTSHG